MLRSWIIRLAVVLLAALTSIAAQPVARRLTPADQVPPDVAQLLPILLRMEQMTLALQTPQDKFVPASEVPTEVLPATPFVFIAYAFVWVALLGYVFGLWRKLTRVERELSQVVTRVEGRRTS